MSARGDYRPEERRRLRRVVLKRAAFLLVLGMLLSAWWPADILRCYGLYLALAAPLMFAARRWFLVAAGAAIIGFHALMLVIPYETGWDFHTLHYADFWTPAGWLRHNLYNGFNPVFPWLAFFMTGMYLGRLDWAAPTTRRRVLLLGVLVYVPVAALQLLADLLPLPAGLHYVLRADYLPPLLPFVLSTTGFGMALIAAFMAVGIRVGGHPAVARFAATGQMTLTHYVSHLILGMGLLAWLSGRPYAGTSSSPAPVSPPAVLLFATGYLVLSYLVSGLWRRRFPHGPLESLMRRLSR
jgi:uncharacterized membrane protein YeiB